jgi:hypothetical protein
LRIDLIGKIEYLQVKKILDDNKVKYLRSKHDLILDIVCNYPKQYTAKEVAAKSESYQSNVISCLRKYNLTDNIIHVTWDKNRVVTEKDIIKFAKLRVFDIASISAHLIGTKPKYNYFQILEILEANKIEYLETEVSKIISFIKHNPNLYTPKQIAHILNLPAKHIYTTIANHKLQYLVVKDSQAICKIVKESEVISETITNTLEGILSQDAINKQHLATYLWLTTEKLNNILLQILPTYKV